MGRRTNTAAWNGKRWRIDVQKDGTRKSFYSSKPGRTGQREANKGPQGRRCLRGMAAGGRGNDQQHQLQAAFQPVAQLGVSGDRQQTGKRPHRSGLADGHKPRPHRREEQENIAAPLR